MCELIINGNEYSIENVEIIQNPVSTNNITWGNGSFSRLTFSFVDNIQNAIEDIQSLRQGSRIILCSNAREQSVLIDDIEEINKRRFVITTPIKLSKI